MAKTKPAAEAGEGEGVGDAAEPVAEPVAVAAAVVVAEFTGVPDGLVYPRVFAPGDTVDGALADVAVAEGWAKRGE